MATDADLEPLTDIYLDSARHHAAIDPEVHQEPERSAARDRIRGKLGDTERSVFVAEVDGAVIGLLELEIAPVAQSGAIVRPSTDARVGIAVLEGRRGEGIGAELMRFAERWARDSGCAALILDMSAANDGALRFYERLGYRTYGLLMRKPLVADATNHAER